MGCIFYYYEYNQEMENKNYSVAIISNVFINELNDKNKNSVHLNHYLRIINKNPISYTNNNINFHKNVNNAAENNPFQFVKIKIKGNI